MCTVLLKHDVMENKTEKSHFVISNILFYICKNQLRYMIYESAFFLRNSAFLILHFS